MPRASWSAATLLLLAHAVPAAQGTHPGPLPSPIGQDSAADAPPLAEPAPYPETRSLGARRASDPRGDLRGASGDRADWGWPPYQPAAPGRSQAPGDYGYGPSPRTGTGYGYGRPSGYWKWVPVDPSEVEGFGHAPGIWPGSGSGSGYGEHAPYAPYGYPSPYDDYAEGYRDAYRDPGYGPPGYGGYGGYGHSFPGVGEAPGYEAGSYYPSSGYYPEPPGAASDSSLGVPSTAPSDPPRGSSARMP